MRSVQAPCTVVRWCFATALVLLAGLSAQGAAPLLEVTFDKAVHAQAYSGRVLVALTTEPDRDPFTAADWFDPQSIFAYDVHEWAPGTPLPLAEEKVLGFPHPLAELPAGTYRARAVLPLSRCSHDVLGGADNATSAIVTFVHDPAQPAPVQMRISELVPWPVLEDTRDVKYVRLVSDRLSAFHGHYVHLYAAVHLPPGYWSQPDRRFPTIYYVDGFGGSVRQNYGMAHMLSNLALIEEFDTVVVYLEADTATGHHVFADSANNGPWGTALVEELIPWLETRFRLVPEPGARFVTGISSGGWSSLWLQITHPDTFGGVWSLSPDPVDFSAFLQGDLYAPDANVYVDEDGEPLLFARPGAFGPEITYRDFAAMERVLGRGGQLYSLEAVFSPRGPDGQPCEMFDRDTGRVDPKVIDAWRNYDIRHVLVSNWATLGPRLEGKLHIFCGERDEFFLERAVHRLHETLRRLGSDAEFEFVPSAGHMLPPYVLQRVIEQMEQEYLQVSEPAAERVARGDANESGATWYRRASTGLCTTGGR